MRILFLTQVLPYPLDAGPKVRAYHVLRYLASLGHEVTLLSFVRDTDSDSALEHLRAFCFEIQTVPIKRSNIRDGVVLIRSLLSKMPFLIARDSVSAMETAVRRSLRGEPSFDAVHSDQLAMVQYALLARSNENRPSPMLTLDQHNAVFRIPKRLAKVERNPFKAAFLNLESNKIARFETHFCGLVDNVVWVTNEDREALHQVSSTNVRLPREKVIPICLEANGKGNHLHSNTQRIMFLGGLHWPPNSNGILWFLREVWPLVKRRAPEAVLTVIGKKPPKQLIRKAAHSKDVEVTGYVEKLTPYLERSAVLIIPLLAGGGMRVKILDAWRWGVPVVSTSFGAEGIQVRDGWNILLGDTPQDFARAVCELFENPNNMASRLVTNGAHTLETHYDWRNVYSAWQEIYPCESYSLSPTRPA